MGKLILNLNATELGEFPLNKERITIGRRPDNDVVIDNLAVSGKHALIITILDDSFLEDLGSTNGTYVNGRLIKKHALKDGDVIGVGKHELRYLNEHASGGDDQFEKTLVIRPTAANAVKQAARPPAPPAAVAQAVSAPPPQAAAAVAAAPRAPSPGLPLGRLQVLTGPIAGRKLDLTKALITLGKPGVQVAVISRRPQGYFLTHIEGDRSNKAFPIVNGQSIGSQAYPLQNQDVIELAGIKMAFSVNR